MNTLEQYSRADFLRPFRKSRLRRLIAVAPLCAALGACGVAPGMRMHQPATIPLESGKTPDSNVQLQVPITDINLALIARLNQSERDAQPSWSDLTATPGAYSVGPGDVLQVTVWDHPELAAALGAQSMTGTRTADAPAGFVVDQDGTLQFPYVGRMHVAGLQTQQIQAQLTKVLAKTFQDPQVTVRMASFRAKQVFIEGEVHTPGSQPINDIPMTLYDAVSRAGGFDSSADQSRVVLVRGGVQRELDLTEMTAKGMSPSRIILKDGDLLRVPARDESGVFVMGEVNKPVTALPMRSGKLTLSDALSQAGSLSNTTADAAQLYVIRGNTTSVPEVFHLDASSPVAMVLANQFDLQPKDIVYVDGNGLVRFSRVLSLLLPAINAGLTAAIVTK
ncbi:polysaccharide biosynthesis/export family protein [Paraburkholderia sp.]|uniref:polysaccharide biosynthesis/export family protein n=1 Tax=Paraburkholderia sp. TaxID=1926495 RepID=UPI002389AFB6|nr:polysaccharide biosynthesis/export family protein [Paraburkholderia sp.]MDE1180419.1 polysaccharide biosynthesis/export family protein [Paraburkholderia sp.]